ncbi:MAG TPA: class I SAM-dependent methyltransferase, partial [bacterium]|nr:class I SAM-dependent methyltransferase [bacterium]
ATSNPPKTLLHFGCGGGHTDHTLKNYFQITGVDISIEMLSLAKHLNPEVDYMPGDMRTLRLTRTFDAVLIGDSINYMLTQDDLHSVMRTAYGHLKADGVLILLVEQTIETFEQNRTFCANYSRGNTEVIFLENLFDADPSDSVYEMTFVYLIREGKKLRIETDRHLSGLFGKEVWRDLLERTGFEVRESVLASGDGCPLFVCRKY